MNSTVLSAVVLLLLGAGTCYAGGSTYDTAAPADEAYELPMTIDYAGDECTIKAEAKTVLAKYLDAETIEYIYGIALIGEVDEFEDPALEWTLFAPTGAALADYLAYLELDAKEVVMVADAQKKFKAALLQHAVKGVYTAKELVEVEVVEPVMGIPITIDPPYPPLKISTKAAVAEVLYADIYICKSIVHIIDSVLY